MLLLVESIYGQKKTTSHLNISYINDTLNSHKLDIYIPSNNDSLNPCIVWIHGGGWKNGKKGNAMSHLDSCFKNGYIIVDINYRLSHEAIFPACISDCKSAIRFLKTNAKKYSIDTTKIGAAGASAGGHLVALLGTSAGVWELENIKKGTTKVSSRVNAVLDLYGPTDLTIMNQFTPNSNPDSCNDPSINSKNNSLLQNLMGCLPTECPAFYKKANPISYVSSDDASFLIVHGTFDCIVCPESSIRLANSLKEKNVSSELILIPHAKHGGKEFTTPEMKLKYLQFFNSTLGVK